MQMPKQISREPGVEDFARRRIRFEREKRDWSTAELARRVTAAGCRMNQSAIWAIESAEPRRAIRLDEADALAKVFDLTLDELMTDPDDPRASSRRFVELIRGLRAMAEEARGVAAGMLEAAEQIPQLADDSAVFVDRMAEAGLEFDMQGEQEALVELAAAATRVRDVLAAADARLQDRLSAAGTAPPARTRQSP